MHIILVLKYFPFKFVFENAYFVYPQRLSLIVSSSTVEKHFNLIKGSKYKDLGLFDLLTLVQANHACNMSNQRFEMYPH